MKDLEEILAADKIYRKDLSDLQEIEKKYNELNIKAYERMVVEDYIACLTTVMSRKCEFAFFLGMINTKE